MSRSWVLIAVIGAIGTPALAVTPFIENHHHQYQSGSEFGLFEVTTFTYVDIPGTTKTVTVPAGTAVINWSLGGANTFYTLIRPVIGTHAPNPPPIYNHGTGTGQPLSGSWATVTEGGTFDVKLQAALSSDFSELSAFNCYPDFGTAWTLAVFPASADNAPAMGLGGLITIAVLMAGGGAIILASRKKVATTA